MTDHKPPFFSIICPAYNCAAWIQATIQSVLDQSFADWELIIVDDGSTDQTANVVRSFYDRRILFFSQSNVGVSMTRNVALAKARGNYIALIDSDDIFPPWTLDIYRQTLLHGQGVDLIFGHAVHFQDGENEKEILPKLSDVQWKNMSLSTAIRNLECITAGYHVFSKKLFETLEFYSNMHTNSEDFDFIFRMDSDLEVRVIRSPVTYLYRQRAGSLSGNKSSSFRGMIELLRRQNSGAYPQCDTLDTARRKRIRREVYEQMRFHANHFALFALSDGLVKGIRYSNGWDKITFATSYLIRCVCFPINSFILQYPQLNRLLSPLKKLILKIMT